MLCQTASIQGMQAGQIKDLNIEMQDKSKTSIQGMQGKSKTSHIGDAGQIKDLNIEDAGQIKDLNIGDAGQIKDLTYGWFCWVRPFLSSSLSPDLGIFVDE